jgi:hypothetical protein
MLVERAGKKTRKKRAARNRGRDMIGQASLRAIPSKKGTVERR